MTHPDTQMANLHSDPTRITPVFTKISATPWDGRSKLCGGYGRRVQVPKKCTINFNRLDPVDFKRLFFVLELHYFKRPSRIFP